MPDEIPEQLAAMLQRIDPELVRACRNQPQMPATDPTTARKQFARALKVSQRLRRAPGLATRVDVRDGTFRAPQVMAGLEVPIRVYRPLGAAAPMPVLVYLHGALLAGDLETDHERCLNYAAQAGCIVISVAYRRPPEHPFPAPTDDCYAAAEWVHGTAHEWDGDPNRIAIAGSSSGATLAASVALQSRDRDGPKLALQMLLYPALDDRYITRSISTYSITGSGKPIDSRWVWRHYTGDDPAITSSPYAVPARCANFAGLAPAYVLVAEVDPLRDEALDYATRMMRAGVPVELHMPARTCHGFDAASPNAAVSKRSLADQVAALRRAFANP